MRNTSGGPKAIIHRNILDVAAANPDASLEELSMEVSGATTDLVERVLEEYGDPSEEPTAGETDHTGMPDQIRYEELTDAQRETLRAIQDDPEATQREIGERLGISGPSVNRRLNAIPGFEWSDRAALVDRLVPGEGENHAASRPEATVDGGQANGTGVEHTASDSADAPGSSADQSLAELGERLATIETRLERLEDSLSTDTGETVPFGATGLVHKVVHACLESDRITEEEELQILGAILGDENDS